MEQTKNDTKYLNGKIYTIRSHQTDKYYIGSTIQPLHKRLHGHRKDFKYCPEKSMSSYEIIKYNDNYIELLEEYPCENKNQLFRREGELIRKYKKDLVNLEIAGRSRNEWITDNRDHVKNTVENYYLKNKKYIDDWHREYNEKNKVIISEKKKIRYNNSKIKYTCNCGSSILTRNTTIHNTSLKHLNYLQTTAIPDAIAIPDVV